MFIAVYKFVVKPGMEEQFCQAWHKRTEEIRSEHESLGSRLHRVEDDGSYVAYAQWKCREQWLESGSSRQDTDARAAMREATEKAETMLELEVVDDLLTPWPTLSKA